MQEMRVKCVEKNKYINCVYKIMIRYLICVFNYAKYLDEEFLMAEIKIHIVNDWR